MCEYNIAQLDILNAIRGRQVLQDTWESENRVEVMEVSWGVACRDGLRSSDGWSDGSKRRSEGKVWTIAWMIGTDGGRFMT